MFGAGLQKPGHIRNEGSGSDLSWSKMEACGLSELCVEGARTRGQLEESRKSERHAASTGINCEETSVECFSFGD